MKKTHIALGLFTVILFSIGAYYYRTIYSNQLNKDTAVYIKRTSTLDDVLEQLKPLCNNIDNIRTVASLKKYNQPKPGKYTLKKGMNANEIITLLRSGRQSVVKVTFNNQNYIEDLAGRLSHQIEADSISILNTLLDKDFLEKEGFNNKTILNICMPYTYDCYWTISPKQLRNKLHQAYIRFWNSQRIAKAKAINLTQNEVISLAAIVHKETQHKPERRRIAGVYLNRIKKGIPLQADPTVIYALREKYGKNIIYKRVLRKDLITVSPYNTYIHRGIPPSAIAMPDIDAIDAVLNAEKHKYYYFCASPKKIGTHNFAKTLSQHNRNAYQYQNWLNKQRIHR